MEHSVHGLRYRLALLAAAIAIIAVGIALKPKEPDVTPTTDMESAGLRRLAQERRLQELGEYISYAAQNAAKSLMYLPELDQTAVALDRQTVATGLLPIATRVTRATSSARPFEMRVQARRPDVPILFLQPTDGVVTAASRADVDTGDWVIAVALRNDATPVFAYGLYENSAEARCGPHTYTRLRASIPLTGVFVGGGLFSLRGSLAGIVARCDAEIVVLSVASVTSALSRPVEANDWLQDRYGLRVAPEESGGVAAVAVWKQSPADAAGIRVGDSIRRIDATDIVSPEGTVEALKTDAEHDVTLRRGRSSVRVRLALARTPGEIDVLSAGFTLVDSPGGAVVRSVRPGSPAGRAGLLAGDIIKRYGGKEAASASALAAEPVSDRQPLFLTVERGGASFDARLVP